jgi:hypothetical protein
MTEPDAVRAQTPAPRVGAAIVDVFVYVVVLNLKMWL